MKDILNDINTGDIALKAGDLVVGNTTYQNIYDLLLADKGFYKFDPFIGVGIVDFINEDINEAMMISKIQSEIEVDGVFVKNITIDDDNKIQIEASYGKPKRSYSQVLNAPNGILKKYTIKSGQTIFDVAMIFYANVEGVIRIMELNNIETLPPIFYSGQVILIDQNASNRTNLYGTISEKLATMTDVDGIGNMVIGSTFKIE